MTDPIAQDPHPLLDALHAHAPPLALVDAAGGLRWCTSSFIALAGMSAQAGEAVPALPLGAFTGDAAAAVLLTGNEAAITAAGHPWRLRATATADGWMISAEPMADPRARHDPVEPGQHARELERRLESASRAARLGLWSVRADDRLPSWNGLMYDIFGLDPAAGPPSLDDWLQRCVPAAERQLLRDELLQWWQHGSGEREFEMRIVRPSDGAPRWILLRGRIDTSSSPGTRRIDGVAQDITEQQQTLRQLRETIERSSLTTRALGLGTWSSDIERKHVVWDAQMFRLRGVDSPTREVGPEERRNYVHPDDRDAVIAAQNAYIRDGEAWRDVFRVRWPDGQVRWITSHSMPLRDPHGQIERRIGVNWDSTDAHLAAQALREREVAVAENQAKSQAMSRISHELRTPLNAILGFTQLLRSGGGDPERRAGWLALVEDASRHLLALIDDVLELSRAQVGEIKLALEAVSCASVIDAALALVASQAEAHQVRLAPEALEGVVLADPLRLRQVMVNLLSNAIKYNRPGGEVRVWVKPLGERVQVNVADTGVGIAPERVRDAFEPFNRLGAEATGVEGSGIGLAIVKVLVELMDGQVSVHSDVGVGSRFSIELPSVAADGMVQAAPVDGDKAAAVVPDAAPAAAPAVEPDAAAAAPLSRAHVLYIEDNPVNALLVREILAQRPWITLHEACDGASGIRCALDVRPALVLIDMQLPDMDGHAVLRALRADPLTAQTPCVVLSANATADDLQAAADAGFDDYWTKPIELRCFLDGVDRFVGPVGSALAA